MKFYCFNCWPMYQYTIAKQVGRCLQIKRVNSRLDGKLDEVATLLWEDH